MDFYNEMRAKIQLHQLYKYICICNSLATDKDFIVLFIPPFLPNLANSGLYFWCWSNNHSWLTFCSIDMNSKEIIGKMNWIRWLSLRKKKTRINEPVIQSCRILKYLLIPIMMSESRTETTDKAIHLQPLQLDLWYF